MSAPAAVQIVRLSDLKPGDRGTFFALLIERNRVTTAKGKQFFSCRFRDARRIASCAIWEDSPLFDPCGRDWEPGRFFKIDGVYSVHDKYGPQFEVRKIRLVEARDESDGFNAADFIEAARFTPAELIAELRELIQTGIGNEPLRRLTLGLIDRHAETIKRLPASERRFYPYEGGWLQHVVNVTQNILWLSIA
jgi:3'-5' exoribonuclease